MSVAPVPALGVGVVYTPGLEPLLGAGEGAAQLLEIEPETLWRAWPDGRGGGGVPEATLAHLRRFALPKLAHGVQLAVGGSRAPAPPVVAEMARFARRVGAPFVSGHLSFTDAATAQGPLHAGFLLPPLQTEEGARAAVRTARQVAAGLPVPLALETGVNYLRARPGELDDGAFTARVVEGAGCGLLLDLHNLWANERNGRQGIDAFLGRIPLDRVWEVHVAGGFAFEGYWLDAHSGPVPEPVRALLEDLLPSLPQVKAVVLEIFPPFVPQLGLDRVREELALLREIWERARARPAAPRPRSREARAPARAGRLDAEEPSRWEAALAQLVVGHAPEGPVARALAADPAVDLLRRLVWRFRAGALVQGLDVFTRLLLLHGGPAGLEALLDGRFRAAPPSPLAVDEALGFLAHLRRLRPPVPYLDDVLALEECRLRGLRLGTTQRVAFAYDPRLLLEGLVAGRIPDALPPGSFLLEVPPDGREVGGHAHEKETGGDVVRE